MGGNPESHENGYFIPPTIFTGTPEDSQMMKEEVFGPVVNINIFKTEEEVMAKANDTEYELYAAVFTKNIDRAMRFAKGLETGTVGVNCTSPVTGKDTPFGGYKGSGLGREGLPFYSLDNFLETKSVIIKIDFIRPRMFHGMLGRIKRTCRFIARFRLIAALFITMTYECEDPNILFRL